MQKPKMTILGLAIIHGAFLLHTQRFVREKHSQLLQALPVGSRALCFTEDKVPHCNLRENTTKCLASPLGRPGLSGAVKWKR